MNAVAVAGATDAPRASEWHRAESATEDASRPSHMGIGMNDEIPTSVAAAERIRSLVEAVEDVAYAEVGGVDRIATEARVTGDGVEYVEARTESGAWCRPFVDGAADYRYVSVEDDDVTIEDDANVGDDGASVERDDADTESDGTNGEGFDANTGDDDVDDGIADMVDRVARSARFLAQTRDAAYDPSTHSASHPGWAVERADERSIDEKSRMLSDALEPLLADDAVERVRLSYTDASEDVTTLTTTGTSLRLAVDRAAVDLTIQSRDAPKIRRHLGTTAPETLWAGVDGFVDDALADVRRLRSLGATDDSDTLVGDDVPTVLSPRAAGQLFHYLSHYFEADTHLMGLSPFDLGEKIGPDALTIRDGVVADSWVALAYDAEGRPTTPTTLVRDGRLVDRLHDTATAIDAETWPAGNVVPSLGFESSPRIHARQLDVAAGSEELEELRDGAALVVDRFGAPVVEDEIEDTQRDGWMPASSLYAADMREHTESADPGRLGFPVAEGWRLVDGEPSSWIEGVRVRFAVDSDTLQAITALSATRETVTGECRKHGSTLPFAVTAPAVRLAATVVRS